MFCRLGCRVIQTNVKFCVIDRHTLARYNPGKTREHFPDVRSRKNELSSISRLPAKILCNIFFLSMFGSQAPWTNFSQSHHWRSSALSAPELWTCIPLSYRRWAKEMLIRSKVAKLTIRCGYSESLGLKIETFGSCFYEMKRIEEIDIVITPELILQGIFRDSPSTSYIVYWVLCALALRNCIFDPWWFPLRHRTPASCSWSVGTLHSWLVLLA